MQKETESVVLFSIMSCSGIYNKTEMVGSDCIFGLQVGCDELLLHEGCVRAGQQED